MKLIRINGIVQGVGFRPFIYKLALHHKISGYVLNSNAGVEIAAQGEPADLNNFIHDIPTSHPPGAMINELKVTNQPDRDFTDFIIMESRSEDGVTLISPDLAVCPDCLSEMKDPQDQRYAYPFINCTNCGPRYSIIRSLPYDRPATSMRKFPLCDFCATEYADPLNRRFHAQPVACAVCGPELTFLDHELKQLQGDPVKLTITALKQGKIVGIKGIGGFHLACDATDPAAVAELRKRKDRPHKPFAVMCLPDKIDELVMLEEADRKILSSAAAPILILPSREPSPLAENVAPFNPNLGVFFPYAPPHYQILSPELPFLIMTSGNINNEPVASQEHDLTAICDNFLTHNRPILNRSDDSVILPTNTTNIMLRRSRGYVPNPIVTGLELPHIMGCGAGLKLTFSLGKENRIFLSPYIGNDNNKRTFDFYEETAEKYKNWFKIEPELYACDLQPDFLTTRYAQSHNKPVISVQHHHAHIAAVMAEHKLTDPVLGVAYDGTGLGNDKAIWGGEIMLADFNSYERLFQLEYMPLPGGDSAIRHPARIAYAYTKKIGRQTEGLVSLSDLEKRIIDRQLENGFNLFQTSSLGRLFDCIAALLGLFPTITFEAQSAMALQFLCGSRQLREVGFYDHDFSKEKILIESVISGVIDDISKGLNSSVIAAKFHNTIVEFTLSALLKARAETGINEVVLCGGVMQNRIILDELTGSLKKNNFTVYSPQLVPPNDAAISFGQAVIAASQIKR